MPRHDLRSDNTRGDTVQATRFVSVRALQAACKSLASVIKPGALVMHCLPAYRGKEITEEIFEANAQAIFDQAENRLHVQKGVLKWLVG